MKNKNKNKNKNKKGMVIGLLLSGLVLLATNPLITDSNSDIDIFEFSHFPKTEINKNPNVAIQIRIIAKEHNFEFSNYLVNLAFCESRLDTRALNAKGNYPVGSIDRGLFQINSYWHKEVTNEQALDLEYSTKWAIDMINQNRASEWVCDDYL